MPSSSKRAKASKKNGAANAFIWQMLKDMEISASDLITKDASTLWEFTNRHYIAPEKSTSCICWFTHDVASNLGPEESYVEYTRPHFLDILFDIVDEDLDDYCDTLHISYA